MPPDYPARVPYHELTYCPCLAAPSGQAQPPREAVGGRLGRARPASGQPRHPLLTSPRSAPARTPGPHPSFDTALPLPPSPSRCQSRLRPPPLPAPPPAPGGGAAVSGVHRAGLAVRRGLWRTGERAPRPCPASPVLPSPRAAPHSGPSPALPAAGCKSFSPAGGALAVRGTELAWTGAEGGGGRRSGQRRGPRRGGAGAARSPRGSPARGEGGGGGVPGRGPGAVAAHRRQRGAGPVAAGTAGALHGTARGGGEAAASSPPLPSLRPLPAAVTRVRAARRGLRLREFLRTFLRNSDRRPGLRPAAARHGDPAAGPGLGATLRGPCRALRRPLAPRAGLTGSPGGAAPVGRSVALTPGRGGGFLTAPCRAGGTVCAVGAHSPSPDACIKGYFLLFRVIFSMLCAHCRQKRRALVLGCVPYNFAHRPVLLGA